jgi:PAS domain-containing protein
VVDRASLRIRHANRAAAQLTGYSESSLAQLTLPELYGRVHRTGIAYLGTITNGQSICFEAQLLSAQNGEISSETQITPCQLDGNPCLICVIRNTSHRPAIERELRKRAAIYRSLVEAIPDLLFRIRRDGTYLEFKLPDNLGLRIPADESEIIGRKIADVVPPHVTELAMPAIAHTLDTGVMQTIEYQIMEPSGPHDYEARFVAIEENEVMALVRDITERKQVETLLRQKDRLLEGVAKATSRLMAPGDQDTAFNEALGLLGEAAGVDRVFIFENHPDSETRAPTAIYRYEWISPHVQPDMDSVQDYRRQAYGLIDWYHVLAAGGIVNLSRQKNSPIDDSVFQTVSSLLIVPVFANGYFWGCVGFEDYRREHEWNGEEISTLRTMAASVGAAAERQQAEASLRLEREIANREREIADTLREVGMALTSTLEPEQSPGANPEQARRVVPMTRRIFFCSKMGWPESSTRRV